MKHGKQMIVLLLAWVMLLCMPVSVAASSTELKTSVPSHVSLTVEVSGKGTVWVGFQGIRRARTISVPRNERTVISLRPDFRNEVESILLDGTDITSQMKDGTLTLDANCADHTVSVIFVRSEIQCPKPDIPEPDHDITPLFIKWIQSVKKFFQWMRPENNMV